MYEKILVAVDGSPTSDRGLAEAASLAKALGARLRLVHVIDQLSIVGVDGKVFDDVREGGEKVLRNALASTSGHDIPADTRLVDDFNAPVSELLLKEARDWGADLIVMGTHGRRGLGRALLGSETEQTLRASPVPVLLVRADG